MAHGTVKFFNAAKGFGFITGDEDGKDVFVPATTVTSAGVKTLQAGQRVTYQAKADPKGSKAVDLKIVASPAAPPKHILPADLPRPHATAPALVTVYIDPESDAAEEVVAAVRACGHQPRIVDYMGATPTKEDLQRLSLLLRESDQVFVRKYDKLFLELRLDDRFVGEAEYWSAIHEHPALINGPIVASSAKANVCRSGLEAKAFIDAMSGRATKTTAKPKGLPESLRRLLTGGAGLPAALGGTIVADVNWKPAKSAGTKSRPKASKKKPAASKPATVARAKPTPKQVAVKPKAKAAFKPKKPGKGPAVKSTPRPAKKAKRAGRK